MYAFTRYCVTCLLIQYAESKVINDDFFKLRNEIIKEETLHSIGGHLKLNKEELLANNKLMQWKRKEIDEGFNNPQNFNFSKHYFAYKNDIEASKTYQIIRKMPKGAALHIHSSYMLDAEGLLELTYEDSDHLYICYNRTALRLQFSVTTPQRPCTTNWILLSELKRSVPDVNYFDAGLKKHFTLFREDEDIQNCDINTVWENFEEVHDTIKSLIAYRPVREKYFYKSLKKFYDDNIMYIEIRSGLSSLYELNGTVYDKFHMLRLYKNVLSRFMVEHPDFVGFKIILTGWRGADEATVRKLLEDAKKFKAEYPELFAGFDLVGQEDLGRPLKDFEAVLSEYKDEIDYYFHCGETNWFGTPSDENLIDAVLLGTKRIGHGYSLLKHPGLLNVVSQKGIALEVNVISNAVLALVRDVRNHPLATYMAIGMPVVLSSDDPGAWGADPLSHDFYVTFVGVASRNYDMRLLKQLAINSITYSALDGPGKANLLKIFKKQWDEFIHYVLHMPS